MVRLAFEHTQIFKPLQKDTNVTTLFTNIT